MKRDLRHLRLSGGLSTLAFLVVAISDLLMLTLCDFGRPHSFWRDAAAIPDSQFVRGYFLGVPAVPFYCFGGWHLALAVRPAGVWASRLVGIATAYCASLLTVWHASFAFTRSILRASGRSEATLAYETFAVPLFRITLVVAGATCLVLFVLITLRKTLYPRWAVVIMPVILGGVMWGAVAPLVPLWARIVLDAAGWNVAGVAFFAISTILLWNPKTATAATDAATR